MSLQTLRVEEVDEGKIVRVYLSRPKSMNAMNPTFFKELEHTFRAINDKPNVRVVTLQGDGKIFTAGLDLKEAASIFTAEGEGKRRVIKMLPANRRGCTIS